MPATRHGHRGRTDLALSTAFSAVPYMAPSGAKYGILLSPVRAAKTMTTMTTSETTPTTAQRRRARLLGLFADRDALDYASLLDRTGAPARTLDRDLKDLLADGALHRWARGLYSRRPLEPALNPEGAELLGLLRESDADAHLTGFDVLAPYAHQFTYGYTHLVYCHPPHLSALAAELSAAGWLLLPAGRHVHLGGTRERTVILRGQTHDERRYPLRDYLALPEKAWVDLLREVRRSRLGLDYGELGRILQALQRAGVPIDKLRTYARGAGYLEWLDAAMGDRPPNNLEQRQLAAGYAA